jgi:hypothetical protein
LISDHRQCWIHLFSLQQFFQVYHKAWKPQKWPFLFDVTQKAVESSEIFGDKMEFVVAAPQYRAAANTEMGWKNSNLPTEMTRLLRRAGVSG